MRAVDRRKTTPFPVSVIADTERRGSARSWTRCAVRFSRRKCERSILPMTSVRICPLLAVQIVKLLFISFSSYHNLGTRIPKEPDSRLNSVADG